MMKKTFVIFYIIGIYLFNLQAQNCFSNRYKAEIFSSQVTQDVQYAIADPYGISSSQILKMDIYEPVADSASYRPLLVYAFGGAYLIGDKRQPDIPTVCNHFAKQGFVVVSIDYRIGFNTISSGSAIRAVYRGIQDIRAAVRFMCENRATYKIDTNYIFYTGSSAGCISGIHSAFMTDADRPSYTYGGTVLLEPDDMGCADCSGNTLFGQRVPKPAGIINRWGAILDTGFINADFMDSIPMISFHGTADPAVPYTIGNPFSFPVFPVVMGSSYIHDRLTRLHIYNELVPLVGAGHEPELIEPRWDDTLFARCTPFLYQILKPKTSAIQGPNTICLFDSAYYSVNFHPNAQYCWFADSGTNIIQINNNLIKIQFSTVGLHNLFVIEQNQIACTGDTINLAIQVYDKPIADFNNSTSELTTTFTNTSLNSSNYTWYFGDGTSSNNISPIHNYSDTGWYSIVLVASNGICQDSTFKNIYIQKCPIASYSSFIDANGQLVVFNNSTYTQHVLWIFGDGDSSSVFNPTHQYSDTGNYSLILYVYNDSNCADTLITQLAYFTNNIERINPSYNFIHIYPNPIIDNINIETNLSNYEVDIVNAMNQIVYKKTTINNNINVNIELLESGIYFINIRSGSYNYWNKFIKQ